MKSLQIFNVDRFSIAEKYTPDSSVKPGITLPAVVNPGSGYEDLKRIAGPQMNKENLLVYNL